MRSDAATDAADLEESNMSDDVDLCPTCGRPSPSNGSTCPTPGCPQGNPSHGPDRPDGRRVEHPRPNRPQTSA